MDMTIDYKNQSLEALIAQAVASKKYVLPPMNAENYKSKILFRELSDREKAIFTIAAQVYNDLQKIPPCSYRLPERRLLNSYIKSLDKMIEKELRKSRINGNKTFVICSNGNIYYISEEDFENYCFRCPGYESCEKHKSQDPEVLIAKIIAKKDFMYSPFNAENFPSREFVRDMTDHEKALLTIIIQIDNEKNLPLTLDNVLEHELLEILSNSYQETMYNEMLKSGINPHLAFIFCSDGKIYYISHEEVMDRCKHCPEYDKCCTP